MTEASLVYQTVYLRCFIGELTAKCAKPSGVGGESRPCLFVSFLSTIMPSRLKR